jgi:hypothetical protein
VERLFRELYGAPLGPDAVLPLTWLTAGAAATLHRLASAHGGGPYPVRAAPPPAGRDGARRPADQPGQAFAARLGAALQAVFQAGLAGAVPAGEIHRLAFQAEREGQHWASRAARCLLGLGACPEDADQLAAVGAFRAALEEYRGDLPA